MTDYTVDQLTQQSKGLKKNVNVKNECSKTRTTTSRAVSTATPVALGSTENLDDVHCEASIFD